jgi:hypothetical protein
MAERKVEANDVVIMIDITGGTSYDLVVCLEDQTFPRSRSEIDAKSKCGPDKKLGVLEAGPLDFSGQIIITPDTDRVSIAALDLAIKNNTTVGWKWGKALPVIGDISYTGTGALSKLDESASTDDVAKFSASLTIFGNYATVTAP